MTVVASADPEGGQDVPHLPLKNHKNIGFLSNTSPDPMENHKVTCTKPEFNAGPSSARKRNAIKMASRWRADDGPLIALMDPTTSPHQLKNKNKNNKKQSSTFEPLWIRTCVTSSK